jgi:hypothetical protein
VKNSNYAREAERQIRLSSLRYKAHCPLTRLPDERNQKPGEATSINLSAVIKERAHRWDTI